MISGVIGEYLDPKIKKPASQFLITKLETSLKFMSVSLVNPVAPKDRFK